MYYYFRMVAGNSKCVAISDTYSATEPADANCADDLDSPDKLSKVGPGLVNCNNFPGDPPRSATVFTEQTPVDTAAFRAMIKKSKLPVAFICCCLWMTGCTTVKRYSQVENTTKESPVVEDSLPYDESQLRVAMSISDARIAPPDEKSTSKSLWGLKGAGQKELLRILASRYPDNDKLTAAISNKYLEDDNDDNPVIDLTKKNVRIVFTISRWHPYELINDKTDGYSPADRIEYIKYRLELNDPHSSLQFTNWNKYSTEYGSIDIADMSFQQSLTVSASLGDSTAGVGASASGSASRTENQKIQYRYIQLNGSLGKKFIELESEGTREVDLSGNTIVDVNMQFDPAPEYVFSLKKDKDSAGNYLAPGKAALETTLALIPDDASLHDVHASLRYNYAYRHVVKGDKTIYEWDDRVKYFTGSVTKPVTLLLIRDMIAPFACVKLANDHARGNKNFLVIRDMAGGGDVHEASLAFPDRTAAEAFIRWLILYKCPDTELNKPIVIGNGFELLYNHQPLTKQEVLEKKDQWVAAFEYNAQ